MLICIKRKCNTIVCTITATKSNIQLQKYVVCGTVIDGEHQEEQANIPRITW